MALGGSVVLITVDWLCGDDLPRLALLPWVALWPADYTTPAL